MDDIPNIRHLRVFLEVARCGSISIAAQNAHLSQPAVTQAMAKLEEELGASLFERRPDGMRPTDIGATFAMRVERALEQLEAGAREANRTSARHAARGFANFDRLVTAAQLRALAALSVAANFSMAARAIGVSQPSIHRAARNLERLAGLTFFDSAPEGITLTHAARAFAMRTHLALSELRQGFEEVARALGDTSGEIVVGSLPLARTTIMPTAIDAMIRESEGIQIRVLDGVYDELLQRLRHGRIDFLIGALRFPLPADDVVQEELFDDPLAIVASTRHPLAGRRNVDLEEALAYPFVAPPRTAPAGAYLFDKLGIGERAPTPIRVVSSSLVLVRGLLTTGDYVTIISTHQIRSEIAQGLLAPLDIPLANSSRPIGLTFRKDWRPTATQRQFLDHVRAAAARPAG